MQMETLTGAIGRLRDVGFKADITALWDGALRCETCSTRCDPARADVDEIVRFEGVTDPADAAILAAIRCGCGHAGLFVSAYGPDIAAEHAQALGRLRNPVVA